jgi:hypothetical protein
MAEMKRLENLKWSPKWVTHLGCVKGCLDYLGIEITDAWLYGGIGHAFVINISEDSCPSGPTAWKTQMLYELAPNLGYQIEGVFGSKYQRNLIDLQKEAWDFARQSIDEGYPVYCWEVDIPEFYVIYGYDEDGYYYSGPNTGEGKGPKLWKELGDTGIGIVELYNLKPVSAKADSEVVKDSIRKTLKHASNPPDWIFKNYASGLKGFDTWIQGLESGKANRFGMGYNAEVWGECRGFAVEFLKEAKGRVDGPSNSLFDEAIEHYQVVADRLAKVSENYPWTPVGGPQVIPVDEQCQAAVGWLKEARDDEAAGLKTLEMLLTAL